MKKQKLTRELRKIGAGPHEAADLVDLASQLESLEVHKLSAITREDIARIPGKRVRYFHIPARYAFGSALAAFLLVTGIAQTSQPGSMLYALKRGTEEIRAAVQPGYVDDLVEERKAEVEHLKLEQAAPEKIQEAERDYQQTRERSEQRQQKSNNQNQDDKDNRRGRGKNGSGSNPGTNHSDNND